MTSLADLVPLLHAQPDPYAPLFDDRLLISLTVALASDHPSLVLRVGSATPDDPRGRSTRHELVRRVADEVAWICAFAFALSSHRVSCSPKLSSSAFLKSLFAPPPPPSASAVDPDVLSPSPSRKDSFASRVSFDGSQQRRAPRRSLTGPLEVSVARANHDADPRKARSPSRLDFLRTPTSPTPNPTPSSAPPSRISFSDLTGPAPDDGESSAGEDLYPPSWPSPTVARRSARPSAPGGSPSPDRRVRTTGAGASRHTVGARDAARDGLGVGLGLGGGVEHGAPRSSSPRLARDGSGYFVPRSGSAGGGAPASLAQQHASYLEQADRRPSIASIASRASASTATGGASPVAPSGAQLGAGASAGAGPASPLRAQHGPSSPSPLASSALATPSSSSRPSSPSRASTPTARSRSPRARPPSSTYPPPSSRSAAAAASALGPLPPSSSAATPAAAAATTAQQGRTLPQVLIVEHLERARPSAQQALLGVLRDRRVVLGASTGAGAGAGPRGAAAAQRRTAAGQVAHEGGSNSAFRPGRRAGRALVGAGAGAGAGEGDDGGPWDGAWNVPEGFVCVAIVWDEGAAGQGAWGDVSRHLLDRFALSHTIPPSSLLSSTRFFAPAPSPSPSSSTSTSPPRRALYLPEHVLPSYVSDSLDTYTSDLVSALRHHPQLDGRMLTAHAVRDLRRATRVWAALTKGAVLSLGPAPASASAASGDGVPEPDSATARLALRVVDDGAGADADADADADATSSSSSAVLVLPADVLAVVLSVVGHRLALRRPEDEKSLFWGSEVGALRGRRGGGGGEGEGGERGLGQVVTVEAVVREVVAVV